jgi:hypothetical protein
MSKLKLIIVNTLLNRYKNIKRMSEKQQMRLLKLYAIKMSEELGNK